ncbi:GIY-YIG nuclease family protein [Corynebacterium glyciniphilum]|uniref:GIY-YIG nuclease family protein n=1 Tax=Corynebacterium glyciniphilum TaxID=1404244 RepID=UPI003FD3F80C
MREITILQPPIAMDAQLPGGEWGFAKYALITEEGDEVAHLDDNPIDPAVTCARMGLEAGALVSYESFIMEVEGFTEAGNLNESDPDDVGERVVVSMGHGGVALDHYLICRPEILSPVTTWRFRRNTPPHRVGKTLPEQGQWLYVIRDSQQRIIYIGISVNAPTRWTQHQADKPWFNQAATFERIWYPTRSAVEAAEAHLIAIVRPPYNTTHNPDKVRSNMRGG